jgi:hypothetical protein
MNRQANLIPRQRANLILGLLVLLTLPIVSVAQTSGYSEDEFGPVVRAYLGYLRNEQEVVDDRVSRREVSQTYYRRNSNRIKALRQMAIRLARENNNDYLPELEAVATDEFGLIFGNPRPGTNFKVGEVVKNTFRFLGTVRSMEVFYVFARLDPYEQADLKQKQSGGKPEPAVTEDGPNSLSRSRRVTPTP